MEPSTSFLTSHTKAPPQVRGFTMIELLVSLGIILLITSVVLLGQNSFNKNLVLMDTTYTIASTVRQAQIFGLSSRGAVNTQTSAFTQNAAYGVHVEYGNTITYRLFADVVPVAPGSTQGGICGGHTVLTGLEAKPGNCVYDSSAEQVTTYTLNRGFKIASFSGVTKRDGVRIYSDPTFTAINITFLRPNTHASIIGIQSGAPIELTSASIRVTSPDATAERCVNVSKVGQIAVGACP